MTCVIVINVGAWTGWQTPDELQKEDRVSAVLLRKYAATHKDQPAHDVSSAAHRANMMNPPLFIKEEVSPSLSKTVLIWTQQTAPVRSHRCCNMALSATYRLQAHLKTRIIHDHSARP